MCARAHCFVCAPFYTPLGGGPWQPPDIYINLKKIRQQWGILIKDLAPGIHSQKELVPGIHIPRHATEYVATQKQQPFQLFETRRNWPTGLCSKYKCGM